MHIYILINMYKIQHPIAPGMTAGQKRSEDKHPKFFNVDIRRI